MGDLHRSSLKTGLWETSPNLPIMRLSGKTDPGMPNFDCRGAGVDVMLLPYDDPEDSICERSMAVGTRS